MSADRRDDDHEHPDASDSRHNDRIRSFTIRVEKPIDWTAFGVWLIFLLHAHGEKILRLKGILNVLDEPNPVIIHGVQHTIHPPQHLEKWPDGDECSRLVFIVRDLDPEKLKKSFAAFCQ